MGSEMCIRDREGERLEGEVARAVAEGAAEAEENVAATIEAEAARGEGRARDVTTESL